MINRIYRYIMAKKERIFTCSIALVLPIFWLILLAFADFIFLANENGELTIAKSIIYFNIIAFFLLLFWVYLCMQNLLQKIIAVVIYKMDEGAANKKIAKN